MATKSKKKKSISKNKVLYESKTRFSYYLLILSFSLFFILPDNRADLFRDWNGNEAYFKFFYLLIAFGSPILLILFKRKLIIYIDRIELKFERVGIKKVRYFDELIYWQDVHIPSGYGTIAHNQLRLQFKKKKIEITSFEISDYQKLVDKLTKLYPEKQTTPRTIWKWFRKQKTRWRKRKMS